MLLNARIRLGCRVFRGIGFLAFSALLSTAPGEPVKTPPARPVTFENDVLPILKNRTCLSCHNSTVKTKDLDLGAYPSAMRGGESGAVVVPGKVEESLEMSQDMILSRSLALLPFPYFLRMGGDQRF